MSLPPERYRLELEKTFKQAENPSKFFRILDEVGALEKTFPELAKLINVPAGPPEHHQEGSAFEHTMMVLDEMHELRPNDELALLMAMAHDLGKSKTPTETLPNHYGHGENGARQSREMFARLAMSREQVNAMKEATRHHMRLQNIEEMRDSTVLSTWQNLRFPDRMIDLLEADARGRIPEGDFDRELIESRFEQAQRAFNEVTGQDLIDEGYSPDEMGGEEFGNLVHQRRVERMGKIRDDS